MATIQKKGTQAKITAVSIVVMLGVPIPAMSHGTTWPAAIPKVSADCANFARASSQVKQALQINEYASAALMAKLAGERAGTCFDIYKHPIYELLQADFYVEAAGSMARVVVERGGGQSDYSQEALQLEQIASSDVQALTNYDIPVKLQPEYDYAQNFVVAVQNSNSNEATLSRNGAPVEVTSVDTAWANSYERIDIGVTFRNTTTKTIVAVRFGFILGDAFGKHFTSSSTGTILGTFAPDVEIKPQKRVWDNTLETQPDFPRSPAWEIFNPYGHDVTNVDAVVQEVRFEDGSVWP